MSRAKTSVLSYDGRRGSSIGYLSWRPSLSVSKVDVIVTLAVDAAAGLN